MTRYNPDRNQSGGGFGPRRGTLRRIEQAGAVPMTTVQVLLELQRDWARRDTYDEVLSAVKEHCGAYGQGVVYAYTMVHKAPASRKPS